MNINHRGTLNMLYGWGNIGSSPVTYTTEEHSICVIVYVGTHKEESSEHKAQGDT